MTVGRHRREEDAEFRLLFVCTGNICRSAFAEVLTRHLLNERLGYGPASAIVVSSAGIQAVVGSGMHPMTREMLRPWGGGKDARIMKTAMTSKASISRLVTSSCSRASRRRKPNEDA